MSETTEDKIKHLCSSWVAAAQQPNGGLVIGVTTEHYRLHNNGINFHELTYEEIQAANVGLSQVLLLKNMNTFIDLDHKLFWAWSGQVLLSPRLPFFSQGEREIQQLFEICIRASLAGITAPPKSKADWDRQREVSELGEFNTRQLVSNAHLVLAYLTLVLLEAVLKKVCYKYISYAGKVITAFDVPKAKGKVRHYVPNDPKRGTCSSLRDLLFLLYLNVSDTDLKPRLDNMRQYLSSLNNNVDPFDLIFSWRNEALHGQTNFPTIGGTLLNFVILILFNQIHAKYDQLRNEIWQNVQSETATFRFVGQRSPWSYYPPL